MGGLKQELWALGLPVPDDEVHVMSQLKRASEFEKALMAGNWVTTRDEAHDVLRTLKMRARARAYANDRGAG